MRILNKISVVGVLLAAVFYLGSCGGGGGTSAAVYMLNGSFTTTNVVGATMAHIHVGDVGKIGAIEVNLTESPPGTWNVPAGTVFNGTQSARLRASGYYVNVHTTRNGDGEIRGQLIPDSTIANKFNATLTVDQEVLPAPIIPVGDVIPTGSGSVTLTTAAGAAY